jgi:hypothetical protein
LRSLNTTIILKRSSSFCSFPALSEGGGREGEEVGEERVEEVEEEEAAGSAVFEVGVVDVLSLVKGPLGSLWECMDWVPSNNNSRNAWINSILES